MGTRTRRVLHHAHRDSTRMLLSDSCGPKGSLLPEDDWKCCGNGDVLLQRRDGDLRPIRFTSTRLSGTQKRYFPQRECLAIIWGIERFHFYFSRRNFTLITDRESLKWLNHLQSPNEFFFRWTMTLISTCSQSLARTSATLMGCLDSKSSIHSSHITR